jgi:hypothetical protein
MLTKRVRPSQAGMNRSYGRLEAEKFVRYLGLWWSPAPERAVESRDKLEYRRSLERLIRVNRTREDEIGGWETAAAEKILAGMR